MKIMDLLGEDEECQVQGVFRSKNKTKQARLPFQSLRTDSPVVNKKRKTSASTDCRNVKHPKVNTKENSFEVSEMIEMEEIIIEKEAINDNEENNTSESDEMKDCSKSITITETQDLKNMKLTPQKGMEKTKKPEIKDQANSLTKFFKKIDNKDKINKKESISKSKVEDSAANSNNSKSKESLEKFQDFKNQKTKQNKNSNGVEETLKKSNDICRMNKDSNSKFKESTITNKSNPQSKQNTKSDDVKIKSNISNVKLQQLQIGNATINEADKTNLNSDINLHANNSCEDDDDDEDGDDSSKSDTDTKKTEYENSDSKDDNKITESVETIPTRNCSVKIKRLTPKQIKKKLEIQKNRENREKQKFEREKKLLEERENKKKEKEEKRRERKEKEKSLKEQKKKDKELRELKKQAEIEQKLKEKEAKEEERKRKEDEKLEAERKKLKAASNFVSFFVAKKPMESKPEEESKIERSNFMPFEIKADMRVAPVIRRTLNKHEKMKLDEVIGRSDIDRSKLYIDKIKTEKFNIKKSGRTWPFEANDDIIIIDEEESSNVIQASNTEVEKHRAKFFLFEENRRPPYWGTWRKISRTINPRRPFAMDTDCFDYEVDSDDEWEEEEPGESLHGSDDEKEKDEDNAEENEYDVDNDFMVPHGYLSEEEIGADEEDEDDINPEKQQTKLKILGEQFEAERNIKTKKLKPKVIGCIWLNKNNAYPQNTPEHAVHFLTVRHIWVNHVPLILTPPADAENTNDNENGTPSNKTNAASSARKAKALEEAMPDLIRLLHGNTHGRGFLVKEFLEYWGKKKEGEKSIPKAKLQQKFREIASWIACPEVGPMHEKVCWYVGEEYRIRYVAEEKLELPNQWSYSLTPRKRKLLPEILDKSDEKEKEKEKEKKTVPLITNFTKSLTPIDKQKQLMENTLTPKSKLNEKSTTSASASKITPPVNKPPKRASLISVPRGEPFSKSPRISLMDKFVTKDNSDTSNNSKRHDKSQQNLDDDDCLIMDNSDEHMEIMSMSSELNSGKIINKSICNIEIDKNENGIIENTDHSDR
ncbi:PREDICTED: chromatin assembly factor 1 subunit A-B [Ceratosolen solmsi marchali]|uniref:Chromatin assembly factor 1 subunit A-B n=1 Tax=Ceratosolen solmsi marchali TaxID=326594 RepID=A0AAJ6YTR8_9HYME|nr:PREDICTED: chromatin assembly factor 1 subunit A-B [Ceratosolen solmsi marchali]